jgi:hypothetical protein
MLLVFPEDELIAVVTAWHILDGTPYTPAVIGGLRAAVRDFHCASAVN